MPDTRLSVDDVFGINRDLHLNYVERESADYALLNNLTRKQHLVIYGSSKQGKTSLRKHCLKSEDSIVIHCSNRWGLDNLHSAILKSAGYELTVSRSIATSGAAKIQARVKIGPLELGGEGGRDHRAETKTIPLELDPLDVNDIILALDRIRFRRYIILEDFHYLPTDTQRDFAVALKAFHENSHLSFIIIGVWLEENRLSVYNGDLTGRLLPINADRWEAGELKEVIRTGEALLNIRFDRKFIEALIASCYDSVFIVQEACHRVCVLADVHHAADEPHAVGQGVDCAEVIDHVVNQQSGRFHSFLTQFAEGFQSTELEMHRWLLYPVLTAKASRLASGFRQVDIRTTLKKHHPRGAEPNPGNVTQSLQSVTSLQLRKEIKPIILDYDQTNLRLNIVDKSFLIWLSRQDREALLEMVGLPVGG